MKTSRIDSGFEDNAREQATRTPGLAVARTHKAKRNRTVLCAAPVRAAVRQRARQDQQVVTKVAARVDVGFGNTLFIRGEGGGLSWDKGQALECVENSTWVWASHRVNERVVFKLLINDQLWSRGENLSAAPGTHAEVVPIF